MKKPDEYVPDVKLYKAPNRYGIWPSDLAEYYDRLDAERGFPKAKLIIGYRQKVSKTESEKLET